MNIQVDTHTITITKTIKINAGEYNITPCEFEFSDEYENLTKKAVFSDNFGNSIELTVVNNECTIPSEVLENEGSVLIGVYGYEVNGEELSLRYSPTPQYFNVAKGSYKTGTQPTPPSPSVVEELQSQITDNRNDITTLQDDVNDIESDITTINQTLATKANTNDLSTVAFSGSYNDLLNTPYIPTKTSDLMNDSGYITNAVDDLINYTKTDELSIVAFSGSYNDLLNTPNLSVYATTSELETETTNRQNSDNYLQEQIDGITASSDVKDIVGTYTDLQNYDTSHLGNNDIIKVLQDSTHNNAMTYYRWDKPNSQWVYIGQEGPYYTKSEVDTNFVEFTDYATQSKGGVVKIDQNYGLRMSNGTLIGYGVNYTDYQSALSQLIIDKATLENVITGKELTDKTYVDNADNLKEDVSNKTTTLSSSSTDTEYPSAKCVYDSQEEQDTLIEELQEENTYLNSIVDQMPKVSGTGTSVSLNNTIKAKMTNSLSPSELEQETTTGKNLINYNATGTGQDIDYNFNGSELSLNGATSSSGQIAITSSQPITLQAGTYTFSSTTSGTFTANDKSTAIYLKKLSDNTNIVILSQSNNYVATSTFTLDETTKVYVQIYTNGAGFVFDNFNIKWQIESGSTATSWEEYTGGIISPNPNYPQTIHSISGDNTITICGKNLFDKDNATSKNGYTKDSSGNDETSSGWSYINSYIKVMPNTEYVLSGNLVDSTHQVRVYYYDINKNWISRTTGFGNGVNICSFTTPNNCYYIQFQYYNSAYDSNTIQIEKGTTVSSFVSYQSQTLPINLGNIEYCEIGDYKDKFFKAIDGDETYDSLDSATKSSLTSGNWYLQKNIGKVVFDGSESWYFNSVSDNVYRYTLTNNEVPYYSSNNDAITIDIISNYFRGTVGANWIGSNRCIAIISNYRILINTTITTLANFKTWLSTHNTTAYYVLATPTYTPLPTSLQNQLEAIYKEALSYNPQTNVSQTNADLPFELEATAFVDNTVGKLAAASAHINNLNEIDNTKEDKSNKVASISASSTDTEYPTAKCVYDLVGDVESLLEALDIGSGV